jgi:hypothetical protein
MRAATSFPLASGLELEMPIGAPSGRNDESEPHRGGSSMVRTLSRHHPFAWQEGRRLWILDRGQGDWVLAELVFEPGPCRYVEVRRASYRWFREAAGALLGRTLAGGQPHAEAAARGLTDWLTHSRFSS